MLPITLEPQQQINLFPKYFNDASNFKLEIVNNGPSSEIRLHVLTDKKEKVVKRTKKKSKPKYEPILLF